MTRRRNEDLPRTVTGAPNASNESPVSNPQHQQRAIDVRELAVPPFANTATETLRRETLVQDYGQELTLDQMQGLMVNVKAAQANLTEGLNALAAYRKTAARILESKRREAAIARRTAQGRASQTQLNATVEASPIVEE